MSKKSRRRNKKILAALALAGGAAMLGRGRKGAVTGVPLNPNLQKTIAADAGSDIAAEVAAPAAASTGNFQTRFTTKGPDGIHRGPMEHKRYMADLPGAGVEGPPSILNPYRPPRTHRMRGMNYKKGGRVTGIAKRGFGRALMKGKN